MPFVSGQSFAGYTIIRLLGSGGMGEVYLAQHPRLPRRDALKLLPPEWSADDEYRARFNREADLASTLWHPHIVGVHDRGEEDGQLWLSMDFVDGLDAARLLADQYPAGMPVDEVVHVVTAVATALDYAHKQGLLHRDVKPANIMMTHFDDEGQQRILLTDFGIARNINDISGLTKTNFTVGTVAYAAPEQLLGEEVDGRADLYSLAATTYHLLTGSQLFPSSNPAVVISHHLNTSPPALVNHRPELAKLDPILAIGLAKRPSDRFERCADFAGALCEQVDSHRGTTQAAPINPAAILSGEPDINVLASQVKSVDGMAGRSRVIGVAATLVIAILVAGLLVIWRPWERQPPKSSPESLSPTTSTARAPSSITATTAVQSPPPPLFKPKAVDQILLTDAQLSKLLGIDVTSNPAGGGGGALALNSSSYGPSDHSGQVTPRSCAGLAFTGEHDVYKPTDFEAIKTQMFSQMYGPGMRGPDLLQQTAAIFPSADQAQAFLAKSQTQWESCTSQTLYVTLGYENARGFTLGSVRNDGTLITVSMGSPPGENGADACQQALGVRENIVVETRTCQGPGPNANANPGYPGNPAWAVPDAARVAKATLAAAKP